MDKISLVKCENYDIEQVRQAVRKAVDHLGGMSAFVNPGETVLLKVNLLIRRKPDKATTTHPAVAQAVAELVKEAGGRPVIGDSPGGYHFYTPQTLEAVYETCGMKEAAQKAGAELNFNTEVVDVPYPEGKIIKNIKTTEYILKVDKIINLPKVKTHMMTVYSGAVKNLFGIIPGRYKAECHLRFEDTLVFADFLIDLCCFARPVLTVMDAVVGMEGYGPTNGTPKQVGLVIAGENPYSLDVVASSVIGLKPEQVPTIIKSAERKLCSSKIGDIQILGENLQNVKVKDFKKPTVKVAFNLYDILIPKFILKRINRYINTVPKMNPDKCKSCKMCADSCPAKAITMENKKPRIDYNQCIRCFCCHELCNYDAIDIKRPWFLKLLLKK
jgi:uncharacterized protein (DUF362 family)/Pyruvate/2-oxoacid:ferredoxin oxidoreductase delta subunit